MSDEPTKDDNDVFSDYRIENDPDRPERSMVYAKDWYLLGALDMVLGQDDENHEAHFGITINSGGLLVSGTAITRHTWIDAMKALTLAASPNVSEAFGIAWGADPDELSKLQARREQNGLPRFVRSYIHMRDVTFHPSSDRVAAPLWRASVADITGWSLGNFSPSSDS